MNRKEYNSDSRYRKVLEQMDLLQIMDITTTRQAKNGTVVWKLPIKDQDSGILIEVASFKTGYVRNQGKSTRSNYQLNKTKKIFENEWPSGYKYYSTRRTLIPIEIDRLEYLISYCLKNYYIKNANRIADGDYVPKWMYDNACKNGHRMLEEQKQYENQRVQAVKDRYKAQLEEFPIMNAKQEQLINKIERIKTFLKHELL